MPILTVARSVSAVHGGQRLCFTRFCDICIRTEIRCDAAGIHGVVIDNGTGISEETLKRLRVLLASEENSSVHTGVYNIHRRIQLLYGRRYGLEISCPPTGGTQVRFSLPAVEKEEKD